VLVIFLSGKHHNKIKIKGRDGTVTLLIKSDRTGRKKVMHIEF